ncbi:MAG TPA: acyl-CoA thioesterase [Nevskiales bacterium]|nr:acyl-CoA thioesterase [Nevskiales bacterium]
MADKFRYRLRVRYGECDAQKVVFNARYGDYIDLASLEFLRAVLPRPADLISGAFDYQLVKQTIEWKAPIRFDDVAEITVWCKHIGRTSFTLAFEFRIAGTEAVTASAETIYVLVDSATLTKTPLPLDVTQALQAGGAGQVVNHAG